MIIRGLLKGGSLCEPKSCCPDVPNRILNRRFRKALVFKYDVHGVLLARCLHRVGRWPRVHGTIWKAYLCGLTSWLMGLFTGQLIAPFVYWLGVVWLLLRRFGDGWSVSQSVGRLPFDTSGSVNLYGPSCTGSICADPFDLYGSIRTDPSVRISLISTDPFVRIRVIYSDPSVRIHRYGSV